MTWPDETTMADLIALVTARAAALRPMIQATTDPALATTLADLQAQAVEALANVDPTDPEHYGGPLLDLNTALARVMTLIEPPPA